MSNMSSQGLKETFAGLGGIQKCLVVFGVSLLLLALLAFAAIAFNLIGAEAFAIFEQSGVRTVAGIAVAGCLLAAIGFGNH
jgi:hypothetical protein